MTCTKIIAPTTTVTAKNNWLLYFGLAAAAIGAYIISKDKEEK